MGGEGAGGGRFGGGLRRWGAALIPPRQFGTGQNADADVTGQAEGCRKTGDRLYTQSHG